jgi:GTP cyclohydrolase I
VPVVYLLAHAYTPRFLQIVDRPEDADCFVDDIIDSATTLSKYAANYPGKPFYALIDKRKTPEVGWVVFPWERTSTGDEETVEDNITRLLQHIGEDPTRGGLKETPARVAKAWLDWSWGYRQDPATIFKCFEDGAQSYDEMVLQRRIPFYSHCEHHMAPFFGHVDIAYIPDGKIVGLSKLVRLTDIYARRLQVQERLTCQIADAVRIGLKPKGVAVRVTARHLCMESRGTHKQGQDTVTTKLFGVFMEKPEARLEFLESVK